MCVGLSPTETSLCAITRTVASLNASSDGQASCAEALRQARVQFYLDQLVADVKQAYWGYSPDTLDSMWAYKSEVLHKLIDANRVGNWWTNDERSAGGRAQHRQTRVAGSSG